MGKNFFLLFAFLPIHFLFAQNTFEESLGNSFPGQLYDIQSTHDSRFVAAGWFDTLDLYNSADGRHFNLLKTDEYGNILWSRSYNCPSGWIDNFPRIAIASNGGITACGGFVSDEVNLDSTYTGIDMLSMQF